MTDPTAEPVEPEFNAERRRRPMIVDRQPALRRRASISHQGETVGALK